MDGFRVLKLNEVIRNVDLLITATGNKNVLTREYMDKMKSGAIVCNMGHSNTEIDVVSFLFFNPILQFQMQMIQSISLSLTEQFEDAGFDVGEGALSSRSHHLARRQTHHLAGRGPVGQLELFVRFVFCRLHYGRHSSSGADRTLQRSAGPLQGRRLSFTEENGYQLNYRHYTGHSFENWCVFSTDEYVASLHLPTFDAHLTELTEEQAKYMGLNKTGPFKPNYYRYSNTHRF